MRLPGARTTDTGDRMPDRYAVDGCGERIVYETRASDTQAFPLIAVSRFRLGAGAPAAALTPR